VQSETGSARVRPRRALRRVFPRWPTPSQGRYAFHDASNAGNASHPEPRKRTQGPAVRSLVVRPRASPGASSACPPVPRECAGRFKRKPPPLAATHARPLPRPSRRRRPARPPRRASSSRPTASPNDVPPPSPTPTLARRPAHLADRAAPRQSRQPRRPPLPGCRCAAYRPPFPTDPVPKSNPSAP
jgi:hypothetical protein